MTVADGNAAAAKALKRALAQLSGIRNAVPNYAATHAHVLAAIRGLAPEEDDLSVAGSDRLSDLESPVPRETAELEASEPSMQDENADPATPSKIGAGVDVEDKYYKEESEEQVALLAVAPVSAFLSVIGGFSLADYDNSKKVWRRRKVKKEAMPLTPEQEQKMAKVEAAASAVLREVHEKLWSRWGEATAGQKEMLGKQIRRGLRHLPVPTTAQNKLVAYLCRLGNDWDSMVTASRLNRTNIHEWSDQDWLTQASAKQEDHAEANDMADSGTDSGESVWEEVMEGPNFSHILMPDYFKSQTYLLISKNVQSMRAMSRKGWELTAKSTGVPDESSLEQLKRLKRIRVLRRIVTAHLSGKLFKLLTAYRLANPTPKVSYASPSRGRFSPMTKASALASGS